MEEARDGRAAVIARQERANRARRSCGVDQRAGAREDGVEHGLGELAGEGVLLRRVVASRGACSGRRWPRRRGRTSGARRGRRRRVGGGERAQDAVPAEGAEADEHARATTAAQLLDEKRQAGVALVGRRLVVGRRAADGDGDPRVAEDEAVVARGGGGLVGEAGAVQRAIEPLARAIAGEDAAGAIGAVGAGRQADDDEAGGGIAEAGDGARPVGVGGVGGALVAADGGAPCDQALAATAVDDAGADRAAAAAPVSLICGAAGSRLWRRAPASAASPSAWVRSRRRWRRGCCKTARAPRKDCTRRRRRAASRSRPRAAMRASEWRQDVRRVDDAGRQQAEPPGGLPTQASPTTRMRLSGQCSATSPGDLPAAGRRRRALPARRGQLVVDGDALVADEGGVGRMHGDARAGASRTRAAAR